MKGSRWTCDVTIWGHTLLLLLLSGLRCVKGKAPAFEASQDRCYDDVVGTMIIPEFMQQDNVYYNDFAGDVTEKGCAKQSERSSVSVSCVSDTFALTIRPGSSLCLGWNWSDIWYVLELKALLRKKGLSFCCCYVFCFCQLLLARTALLHFPFHSFVRVRAATNDVTHTHTCSTPLVYIPTMNRDDALLSPGRPPNVVHVWKNKFLWYHL